MNKSIVVTLLENIIKTCKKQDINFDDVVDIAMEHEMGIVKVSPYDIKFHVHDDFGLIFDFNCPKCHAKVVMHFEDSGYGQCDCRAHWVIEAYATMVYEGE